MLQTPFRIAFDLDGTLLSEGYGEFPTTPLPSLLQSLIGAPLRQGTLPLLRTLQERGVELGIYTCSNRTHWRLRLFFALLGVRIKTIVTYKQHQQALQAGRVPAQLVKCPQAFGFDLLVDNEIVVAQQGERSGFSVVLLASHDRNWTERVLGYCPNPQHLPLATATL